MRILCIDLSTSMMVHAHEMALHARSFSDHADCIYHEHIIEGLLQTCLRLCTPKTTGATPQGGRLHIMSMLLMQCYHGVSAAGWTS